MSTIDFSPTAYTVTKPGKGDQGRYTEEQFPYAYGDAKRFYTELATKYPNLARFVVPDHYIQEYCREYDRGLYSGSRGFGTDNLDAFFRLAEVGAGQAKFS